VAGGIQKGTVAASVESRAAEKRHTQLIEGVIEQHPRIKIRKSVPIDELFPDRSNEYSRKKNGKPQQWEADGGWLEVDGKIVGVAECKYQSARENACERASRYLTVFPSQSEAYRIFVSCYGDGFVKQAGGGSTGPFIDTMRGAGVTLLENPTDEEFNESLTSWLAVLLNEGV